MPMLMSRSGDGGQYPLKQGSNRIGRNPSNDCRIDDTSISGTHCEIIVEGDTVRIRDLDSTNGTFIDDLHIRESFLREGQTIRLGSRAFCFVLDAPRGPEKVRLRDVPPQLPVAPPPDVPPDIPLPPVATGVNVCANHPTHAAAFRCKKCGGHFCGSCVKEQTIAHRKLRFCRSCGDECVSLREPAPKQKRAENFFELLPGAFVYPLKRDGLIMLVAGTVFFGFLNAIVGGPHFGGFFVGANVLIVQLFALGYLIAYMKAIVVASAYGEDEMPKWPDFGNFYDDILFPILLMTGCLLLCFIPAVIYWYYIDPTLPGWESIGFVAIVGLGCCALPMSMLAAFLHETVLAANPLILVVSICRVPVEYLIACLILGLLFGFRLLTSYLTAKAHIIPVIPTVLDGLVSLYLLSVEMRIIGNLFRTKRKQLRWTMS